MGGRLVTSEHTGQTLNSNSNPTQSASLIDTNTEKVNAHTSVLFLYLLNTN